MSIKMHDSRIYVCCESTVFEINNDKNIWTYKLYSSLNYLLNRLT